MANVDSPFGLRPIRHKSGAPYNGACERYVAASGYATNLFVGDPVVITGNSNSTAVRGYAPGTLSEVEKATAGDGNAISGVIVGFEPVDGFDSPIYGPASTQRIVLVADDPDLVYLIQDDGGGTLTADTVGLNAVLIYTHSGSTVTGRSGVELDGGTSDAPDADASNQLTIQRIWNAPDNELADNAVWEVTINQHSKASGAIGVA